MPTELSSPIIITQVPHRPEEAPNANQPALADRADGMDGARLLLVSSDGLEQVLSEGFHSACDPNVSFDGRHLLFAGKMRASDPWRVWEMGIDGQGLRSVSPEGFEARHPIYAATLFTLDSPEPWPATIFVGQESGSTERGRPAAASLYNVKLDGTELRRLTYNPSVSSDPFQMWDGRIVYAGGRLAGATGNRASQVGLFAIHVEGTDMELYGGELGQRVQQMPCATDTGVIVFVEADRASPDGAGQLACIEARRPHVTYRRLTKDGEYLYRYPSPLKGGRVLVSRRAATGSSNWNLVSFDVARAVTNPVHPNPDADELQAVLVESRPKPDGHSTVVDTRFDTGIFYGLNCYDSTLPLARHLQTGQVKQVRFIEGVSQSPGTSPKDSSSPSAWVARRLIGEAPVEADGSFNVEVPADVPLLVQTLDDQGLAQASCGWIWVKPKEKRGCIGCHEDPERVPENAYVLALRRPSNRLVLPPSERRSVSFREAVLPILQRHCATAGCHGGQDTPLPLPLADRKPSETQLQQAYTALLAPPGKSAHRYVDPGQARTSWLVWQMAGRDTSRPWDQPPAEDIRAKLKIHPMPPAGDGEALTPEELRTMIQWIDMGAQFGGPPESQGKIRDTEK